MGRLTLNVLLSFAQFEREVTSERIRDKIAASKRKGLWVGGTLPLGYEMKDGKIAIVEEEAELVRSIYRRYLELGSVNELVRDLRERNIRTRTKLLATGATRGGIPFGRGALYWLLGNHSTSARSNTRMRSCRASSHRSWVAHCLRQSGKNRSPNGPTGPSYATNPTIC